MEFKFEGMSLQSENDFLWLAYRINNDPEFAKRFQQYGVEVDGIDIKEFMKGYHRKMGKIKLLEFRVAHECADCVDKKNKACKAIPPCKYESDFREKDVRYEKPICPMDKKGDCPYGRPEGMCIGMPGCYRELIESFRGGNGRNEKSKKEAHNGKR